MRETGVKRWHSHIGRLPPNAFADAVKVLNLMDNDIGEHGAVALAAGLKTNRSVQRVVLRGNRIGLAGAGGLARVILQHPALRVLDVCNNDLRVRGAQELVTAVHRRQGQRQREAASKASAALERAMEEADVVGGPGARDAARRAMGHTQERVLAVVMPEVQVKYSGNFVSWEVYNSVIHGIGLLLSTVGAVPLLTKARASGSVAQIVGAGLYTLGLLGMFLASTLGHSLFFLTSSSPWLRVLDKLSIFTLVAGTYTPFMLVNLANVWWSRLFLLYVWGVALLGMALAATLRGRSWITRATRISSYFLIGWSAVVPLSMGWPCFHTEGMVLLLAGGLIYSAGILFYLRERLFPSSLQGLWYWLVILASGLHYAAVYNHVGEMPLCGRVSPPPLFPLNSASGVLASMFGLQWLLEGPHADLAGHIPAACAAAGLPTGMQHLPAQAAGLLPLVCAHWNGTGFEDPAVTLPGGATSLESMLDASPLLHTLQHGLMVS